MSVIFVISLSKHLVARSKISLLFPKISPNVLVSNKNKRNSKDDLESKTRNNFSPIYLIWTFLINTNLIYQTLLFYLSLNTLMFIIPFKWRPFPTPHCSFKFCHPALLYPPFRTCLKRIILNSHPLKSPVPSPLLLSLYMIRVIPHGISSLPHTLPLRNCPYPQFLPALPCLIKTLPCAA